MVTPRTPYGTHPRVAIDRAKLRARTRVVSDKLKYIDMHTQTAFALYSVDAIKNHLQSTYNA